MTTTTCHAGGDDWLRPFRDALGGVEGQLGAQLQDEKERVSAAEAQVSKLDAELLAEREAREKQEERASELEAGLEDLRAQIPKFEERMAELERDLSEAESLVEQLQKNRTSLEAELASEKATSEQLQIKIAALQDMYTSVSDELEGMQGREEMQHKEQMQLHADLAASQESKTRLESLLAERDEELAAAQARLTTIKGGLGAAATAFVKKFKKPSEDLPP